MIKNIFGIVFGLKTLPLLKGWSFGFCIALVIYTLIRVSAEGGDSNAEISKSVLFHTSYWLPISAFLYPYSNFVLEGSNWLEKQFDGVVFASSFLVAELIALMCRFFRALTIFLLAPIIGVIGLLRLHREYIRYKNS